MIDLLRMLNPFANWWNGIILALDLVVSIFFYFLYKKTKSRNLLTAMPGLFTSLGILGTFGAICSSLAGISAEPAIVSTVGQTVEQAAKATGNLDLKRIIADLIPAFSTSIYGLLFAIGATAISKTVFAREDANLSDTLRYKDPETAIEALDDHVLKLTEANAENNQKLTDSIAAQSEILSKFVDSFIEEMQGCFTAMKATVEERVTSFGTSQFAQSRELLEGITKQLGEDAVTILSSHKDSIQTLAEKSASDLSEMRTALTTAVDSLKTGTVSGIEELTKVQSETLKQLTEDQNTFNSSLLSQMSSSLHETTNRIITGVSEQVDLLKQAIKENIEQLNDAYDFISEKSSSIVANYEQATESYQDAVQNAHDLNEKVEKGLGTVGESLKSVGKTNENVEKVIDIIESKETNMEAIVMRIEELGNAIVALQNLESVISRLAAK